MTQSDKDPFWQPPKDYSDLPDFNIHFERLIQQQQDQEPPCDTPMRYDRRTNSWKRFPSRTTDQTKLRDFLRNLDNNNDPNSQNHVGYSEWLEVYTTLKDSITEEATAKTLLHITEEMEKWRLKFPAYAQHYWGIDHDEDR
jgi:hypothetical protein